MGQSPRHLDKVQSKLPAAYECCRWTGEPNHTEHRRRFSVDFMIYQTSLSRNLQYQHPQRCRPRWGVILFFQDTSNTNLSLISIQGWNHWIIECLISASGCSHKRFLWTSKRLLHRMSHVRHERFPSLITWPTEWNSQELSQSVFESNLWGEISG